MAVKSQIGGWGGGGNKSTILGQFFDLQYFETFGNLGEDFRIKLNKNF